MHLFVLHFLFFSLSVDAKESPKFILEDGKPVQMILEDGRVATVMRSRKPPYLSKIPLEFFENTCTERLAHCEFHSTFQTDLLKVQWTAHPEPSKIGSTVKVRFGETAEPYEISFPHMKTHFEKTFFPKMTADVADEEIVCQDYSFLPGAQNSNPPASVWISRWGLESMILNPETGIAENRTGSGAYGVELVATAKNTLKVMVRESYFGSVGDRPFLQLGDIIGWTIRQSSGDFCQIGIRSNFGKFIADMSEYGLVKDEGYKPLIHGEDEFSLPHFLNQIFPFRMAPQEYSLE